eukprot:CAMPEP_0194151546 /NCGR_PEP_ID=MMETSP0152-20130528/48638_1 /TAXON_ID=1049557 /ORGANISM="Thalassiothrix antarctica, Strain L6-D1" /LENGTH=628 /DNA_ID=CAMNT_0038855423 /DNA_START=434 /DNA_END=2320 /DNA_ORIENTATION=+
MFAPKAPSVMVTTAPTVSASTGTQMVNEASEAVWSSPYTPPPWESPVHYTKPCRACEDKRPFQMVQNGNFCSTIDTKLLSRRCTTWRWRKNKFCRLSCFLAGMGYHHDECCIDYDNDETSIYVIAPTLAPVSLTPTELSSKLQPIKSPTAASLMLLPSVSPTAPPTIAPLADAPVVTASPIPFPMTNVPISLLTYEPVGTDASNAPTISTDNPLVIVEVIQVDHLEPTQISVTNAQVTGIMVNIPTDLPLVQAVDNTNAPIILPYLMSIIPSERYNTDGIEMVSLPSMEFRLTGIVGLVTIEHFRAGLVDFVKKTVQSNAKILGDITDVDLDVSILENDYERRTLFGEELVLLIEGDLYFRGDTYPTTERMTEVLNSYFANWGCADLRDYLRTDQVRLRKIEVLLDGEIVESVAFQQQYPPMFKSDESIIRNNNKMHSQNQNKDEIPSWVLILGLISGCIALVVAISLVYWQRKTNDMDRRLLQQQQQWQERTSKIQEESPETSSIKSSHEFDKTNIIIPSPSGVVSFSGVSMEDSIYTSSGISGFSSGITSNNAGDITTDLSYEENSQGGDSQYNTKRLNKVIASVQEFVAAHGDNIEDKWTKLEHTESRNIALKTSNNIEARDCGD